MSPEVEATAFFLKNFVSLPQQAESMRGYLELLVPMYNRARPSSALHLATNAVSLAACGNYPGRQHLLQQAGHVYGQALRRVNEELKDPVRSKSDEIILAVLLFSLYETIMSTNDTITAWANHVDGAVALTKLRGREQFQDPMSHAVFRAVRTMMITSCVQRSKPVDAFPGEYGWQGEENDEENAANRLTIICIDLPSIRARATALTNAPRSADREPEAYAILDIAQMVDANLREWSRTLPPEWQYRTAKMVYDMPEDIATSDLWPGPQHVYDDVHIANIINDYRVCRIFCQNVVIACVEWLGFGQSDHYTTDLYKNAVFIVQQMADEISACVPFHMRYDMQPMAKKLGQDQDAAAALGGYLLVWPLYVAANAETVPQRQRDWLSGRLLHIGTYFGLSSAQVLVLARRHVLTCGPMFP